MTFSALLSYFRTFQVLHLKSYKFGTFQDPWEHCELNSIRKLVMLLLLQRKLTSKQPRRHCWKCGWSNSLAVF